MPDIAVYQSQSLQPYAPAASGRAPVPPAPAAPQAPVQTYAAPSQMAPDAYVPSSAPAYAQPAPQMAPAAYVLPQQTYAYPQMTPDAYVPAAYPQGYPQPYPQAYPQPQVPPQMTPDSYVQAYQPVAPAGPYVPNPGFNSLVDALHVTATQPVAVPVVPVAPPAPAAVAPVAPAPVAPQSPMLDALHSVMGTVGAIAMDTWQKLMTPPPPPQAPAAPAPKPEAKPAPKPEPKPEPRPQPAPQPAPEHQGLGSSAVSLAKRFLGVPYVWGGTTPRGFDCSGLLQYVYAHLGKSIPRVAADQFNAGSPVAKSDLKPGDAVFFKNTVSGESGITHVGMYVGNGQFVQAPHTGDVVKISDLSDPYYVDHYAGARRYA